MDSTSPDDPPGPQREERRQHPRMKIAVEAELQSERQWNRVYRHGSRRPSHAQTFSDS